MFSDGRASRCYTLRMRRIAATLALLLAAGCTDPDAGSCEEPSTVTRPTNGPEIDPGLELSHCQILGLCLFRDDCTSGDCVDQCVVEVFGAEACGCCGPDCDDTCDRVVDLAIDATACDIDTATCSEDEREARVVECSDDPGFPDRSGS